MSPDLQRGILRLGASMALAASALAADGTRQDQHQQSGGVVDFYDASGTYTGQTRNNSRGGQDVYDRSNALIYATARGPDGEQTTTTSLNQPPWSTATPDYSGGIYYLNSSGGFFWQQVPNYSGGSDQYTWDGTIMYSSNSLSVVDMSETAGAAEMMGIFDFANPAADPAADPAPADPVKMSKDPELNK